MCERYAVSRSGYYQWKRKAPSAHAEHDRALLGRIQRIYAASQGSYGAPRIHRALRAAGIRVGCKRVARLMREAGLRARAVEGYRGKAGVHRFYAQHPNRLRSIRAASWNQIWVSDITYLRVQRAWWYLAVVMDQYSRRVVAWTLAPRRDAAVVCAVLRAAAARRRPPPGLIFHSDRGSEYLGAALRERLTRCGMQQSASARGPSDNAHMESFFHSLKAEIIRGTSFPTARALRRALRHYIHYYNHHRLHSALDYKSPVAFEAATS